MSINVSRGFATELLKDAVYPAVCPLCGDLIPTAKRIAYHRALETENLGKLQDADRSSCEDEYMQSIKPAARQSKTSVHSQPEYPVGRQKHHQRHNFRAYYQGLVCDCCLAALNYVNAPCCEKCGKPLLNDSSGHIAEQSARSDTAASDSDIGLGVKTPKPLVTRIVPSSARCETRLLCSDCRTHERSFAQSVALFSYDERMRDIMTDIKYKGRKEYLKLFGVLAADRFGDWMLRNGINCLIPVPVHASRLKKRGYNQSELLCEHISKLMHIPVRRDIIVRSRKTAAQKELNADERLLNLQSAFEAAGRLPSGTRALIADDIYTTGSTMEACTERILEAGASKVYGLALCIGEDKNR